MQRFTVDDEAGQTSDPSARLTAFIDAIREVTVPSGRECASVQGELLAINDAWMGDYFRNGLANYYACDGIDDLVFLVDTLVANQNAALDDDDVRHFRELRPLLFLDWTRTRRIQELEEMSQRSPSNDEELAALCLEDEHKGFLFEDTFDRAERCIANWCIANPDLVDRSGRAVMEGATSTLRALFRE